MVPSIGGVLEAECVDFSGMQIISSIEINTAEGSAKEEMHCGRCVFFDKDVLQQRVKGCV